MSGEHRRTGERTMRQSQDGWVSIIRRSPLLFIIIVLIAYIVFVKQLRWPRAHRTVDIDKIMADWVSTVSANLGVIAKDAATDAGLATELTALLTSSGDVADMFKTHLEFRNSLSDMEQSLLTEADVGNIDKSKVLFHEAYVRASARLRALAKDSGKYAALGVQTRIALQETLVFMDQEEQINKMSQMRRKSVMGVMTFFYAPIANEYVVGIGKMWASFPTVVEKIYIGINRFFSALSKMCFELPCQLAYPDPEERAKNCKPIKRREGFADAIFKIAESITHIADIIQALLPVVMAILDIFMEIVNDPIKGLVRIIALVIGVVIGVVGGIIFYVLSIIGPLLFGHTVTYVYFTGRTVWTIIFIAILALPYLILWILDMIMQGAVMRLMMCENSPSLHEVASLANGNRNHLLLGIPFMCMGACPLRSVNSGCCSCVRLPKGVPDYCPQQQIARILRNDGGSHEPVVYDRFVPHFKFRAMGYQEREKEMLRMLQYKKDMYGKCYQHMSSYDDFNKEVCRNVATLNVSTEARVNIARACRECFCNFRSNGVEQNFFGDDVAKPAVMVGEHISGNSNSDENRSLCSAVDSVLVSYQPRKNDTSATISVATSIMVYVVFAIVGFVVFDVLVEAGHNLHVDLLHLTPPKLAPALTV